MQRALPSTFIPFNPNSNLAFKETDPRAQRRHAKTDLSPRSANRRLDAVGAVLTNVSGSRALYAPLMHFAMKLFLAAP